MPSSPGYKRDYKSEYKNYHSKPEQRKKRAMRNKAHATLEKALGRDIKGDVDHKKPLAKGGTNSVSNLRVQSASRNRSFRRTRSAGMA
jgi:5-methylcytosine-specific restriction endonuclease McrA